MHLIISAETVRECYRLFTICFRTRASLQGKAIKLCIGLRNDASINGKVSSDDYSDSSGSVESMTTVSNDK
jgi:hypothetical protein